MKYNYMTNLKFCIPNYSRANNKINRLPYNIYWVPFMAVIKYFKNYENIYFLVLAVFQLLTFCIFPKEWSPTGPFSTAVPLTICIIFEIITAIFKWYIIWKQDKYENNKIFRYINRNKEFCDIKNEDIYPGIVLYLAKNDISPVDGILMDTVMDDYAKINLALLTGETNIHHISNPSKKFILDDYFEAELIDQNINLKNEKIKISKSNMVVAGAINKSEGIYLWVTACGNDKKNKISKIVSKKNSRINQFISNYMMKISVPLLISMVIIMSAIKTMDTINPNLSVYLLFCVQNWILFNGIIPFSVKIFLILARSLEAYYIPHDQVVVNDPLQIDDLGKIKKIVCDKTGTITKNELEFTKIIIANTNNIIDVGSFSTKIHVIPSKIYECLGLCIHQTENDFSTIEDKVIRAGYQSLGAQCIENQKGIILKFNDCTNYYEYIDVDGLEFSFDRKISSKIVKFGQEEYFIYSKGSLDTIYKKINYSQQQELTRIEKIICHKYPELRLLALAYKKLNDQEINLIKNSKNQLIETDLIFLGIIGIRDIIQPKVLQTVNVLDKYGTTCSLCTGDRRITAIAVAAEVNIVDKKNNLVDYSDSLELSMLYNKTLVFNGEHINSYELNEKFRYSLVNCKNFIGYNMTPENKKKIILLLEKSGINTLAIGDGFNDLGMFDSANISVGIKGNDYIENYTDFSVKQFYGLKQIFNLSIESYNKNSRLINFTFYRCSTVIFAIVIHYLMNYHDSYECPFNGFVLQAFNFAWTIFALLYTVIQKRKSKNKIRDFIKMKTLENLSYKSTSIWHICGILNGSFIIYFCHIYGINNIIYFNDILALFVIVSLNIKLLHINNFGIYAIICSMAGIINFLIYILYTGSFTGVIKNILNLPYFFYLFLVPTFLFPK